LAAGMGTRLKSVTGNLIPKGFLSVNDKGLVERSIEKLLSAKIEKIYIVTGHLNEFYDELSEKYKEVETFKNEEYATTGSMYSLAVLKDVIKEDFLLLESDLIYEKLALEEAMNFEKNSCILLSDATNSGDEVYIEVRDGKLHRASKSIEEVKEVYGELVGINKISVELFKKMVELCENSIISQYHYEYAVIESASFLEIGYKRVDGLIWAEIDDESHLKRVNELIMPRLIAKGDF
ncbi:MAG: phosphocholine cytidylyltransferase family protein, partial [Sarcina sp.]